MNYHLQCSVMDLYQSFYQHVQVRHGCQLFLPYGHLAKIWRSCEEVRPLLCAPDMHHCCHCTGEMCSILMANIYYVFTAKIAWSCLSVCFISKSAERILIKFDIVVCSERCMSDIQRNFTLNSFRSVLKERLIT